MFKRSAVLLLLLSVLSLSACDSGEESDPTVTGSWQATTVFNNVNVQLNLQLVETSSNINGTGTLNMGGQTIALTVTGVHSFPSVSLTGRATGFEDINFTGNLGADERSITGTLNGSGFSNFGINLQKQ